MQTDKFVRNPMTQIVRGSCLCGLTAFDARLPAKWVAHCHCSRCQRAHGAAFVTWVGFDEQAVTLNSIDALRWYTTTQGASRGFCSNCGSPLFFKSPNYPGELHIVRAAFHSELEQQPTTNVFFGTHARWATDVNALPVEPEPTWSLTFGFPGRETGV